MGRSSRNRRKSPARAAAVPYRRAGSRATNLWMIVSRSRGNRGVELPEQGRIVAAHPFDQLVAIGGLVGRAQSHQLIEREAQAVEVGPRVAPPREAFRGHVANRAQDIAGAGQILGLERLGQPEVGHPDVSLRVQQQVRRLDVAMENALPVGVFERQGDLKADPGQAAVSQPVPIRDGRQVFGRGRA